MTDVIVLLGVGMLAVGLLWGLALAFQKSIMTGILTLVLGMTIVPFFLLFVRPPGYKPPLGLIGGGVVLAALGSIIV